MGNDKERHERVIHTRVPESLETELKERASELGVSVSNLVRNVLQHALGLVNDIVKQVSSNFTRTGNDVNVVFGAPVDFGDLLDRAPSPRLHREISERAMSAIRDLGEEERALRAAHA